MAALVVLAAVGVAAAAVAPSPQLLVTGDDGQVLWRLPVRSGTQVTLAYVNSIYNAPTEERFTLTADGFTLTSVRSTSEAVLAYNTLPGPYARDGSYFAAAAGGRFPTLTLRIGQTGRQRLIADGTTLPLYAAGVGARLRLAVVRSP